MKWTFSALFAAAGLGLVGVGLASGPPTPPGAPSTPPAVDLPLAAPADAPDLSPWTDALGARFLQCLQLEGSAPESADAAAISAALGALAPLLGRQERGDCSRAAAAVAACAAAVPATPCDRLHDSLAGALRGEPPGGHPAWASAYGGALADRVAACFEVEAGAPPSESQARDLRDFGGMLAGAVASFGPTCALDEERHGRCVQAAGAIPCHVLAERLEDDPATLVQAAMAQCDGFLDCGF